MSRFTKLGVSLFLFFSDTQLPAQTIGTFNSVKPTSQTQNLVLPSTHTFQRIIKTGDALTLGGSLGNNLDFTGYVPISGSSTNGYLSISSESTTAECAELSISLNTSTQLWKINSSGKVSMPSSELGKTSHFCAGTVTPSNTVMVCEESTSSGDANGDGYQDIGWIIEIDPATRKVINEDGVSGADKLWAVGRQIHEDVAIKKDKTVMYWAADASSNSFVYKFVPTTPGNFSAGKLYVLVSGSSGSGTWKQIPNSSKSERNNVVSASQSAGAHSFGGVEGLEIGPDGKIYFSAKSPGVIYRFTDNGSTVSNLGVFVASTNYDVDGSGPYSSEPWGKGNDNLAFDGEGNLWVLQDGDRNHIWVVGKDHTASNPKVRLFATTPIGCEPTGITFSPDYRYLFLSIQHPSSSNTSSQKDAAGASVVFDRATTVVIARKEFLGSPGSSSCAAPSGLFTNNITSTVATINWAAVSGAVSYAADYKKSSSSSWTNITSSTTALKLNLTGLTAGISYDWRVRTNCSGSSSSYTVSQFTTSGGSSTCPGQYDVSTNGSISGAAIIPINTDIKGTINPSGDNDYYKFLLSSSGQVTITLKTLPQNYQLKLYNSSGKQIGESITTGLADETITQTLAAGTYYARAYPSDNPASFSTSCYTLRVQQGAALITGNMAIPAEANSEISAFKVSLYPNPVQSILNVRIDGSTKPSQIRVLSLEGNLVYKNTSESNNLVQVNTSSFSAGIYLVEVVNNRDRKVLRFVKK